MTLPADAASHLMRAPMMQNVVELVPRYFIVPVNIPITTEKNQSD